MAKYSGIVNIKGAIGDLVFYKLNGVDVVRRKSGFNKDAYNSNPNYAKVKQNSSEFGHVSKSGKMLRDALSDYLNESGDKYLYQKFAKLMAEIKNLDETSERGKRRVQIGLQNEEGKKLLREFIFGDVDNLSQNTVRTEGFFTDAISTYKSGFTTIELITLKPDFENYTVEIKSQKFQPKGKQSQFEFDKQFPEEPLLLYFLVLKKNDVILNMGFI